MIRKIRRGMQRLWCILTRPEFMATERGKCSGVPGFGLCEGCRYRDPEGLKEWN